MKLGVIVKDKTTNSRGVVTCVKLGVGKTPGGEGTAWIDLELKIGAKMYTYRRLKQVDLSLEKANEVINELITAFSQSLL